MRIDLIVTAAQIITMDPARPSAHRIGIHNERIVGFDDELDGVEADRQLVSSGVVIPGFIDAHCHTTWWGLGLDAVDLSPATTVDEVLDLLGAAARAKQDPQEWLHATGYSRHRIGGTDPTRNQLDAISGSHPTYVRHVSGHSALTNSVILDLLGVDLPGFSDPVGGVVIRDGDGRATGLLEESAQGLVQALLLPYSAEQIASALAAATSRYAAQGITSFAEAGVAGGWIGHSPVEVAGYQLARSRDELHARAHLMPILDALSPVTGHRDDFDAQPALGLSLGMGFGAGDDWVRLSHVKTFLDGSLAGGTAAVTDSLCGHPHSTGYLLDEPESYRERALATARAGWPLALHAIGDRAIDLALDLISEALETFGPAPAPHRIEHFGVARGDQVQRAGQLGVAVTPQASFIEPLGDQFAELVGAEREGWLYRGRSVVEAGVILAGSTDLPVASNNIRLCLSSAIGRRTRSGRVIAPQEALTPEQALHSYTLGAATAMGRESDLGSLSRGKLGDLVILSGSPVTAPEITELEVLATIVGGSLRHHSEGIGGDHDR